MIKDLLPLHSFFRDNNSTKSLRIPKYLRQLQLDLFDFFSGGEKVGIFHLDPGVGKTTYLRETLYWWYSHNNPYSTIAYISSHYHIANMFAKNLEEIDGVEVKPFGVTTSITGYAFDLILIDDPFKLKEDIENKERRNKYRKWFLTTVLTRLNNKDSKVLLFESRWDHKIFAELYANIGYFYRSYQIYDLNYISKMTVETVKVYLENNFILEGLNAAV